ncbi:MAG: ribosome maturation factor RimM [Treponema sp.]|jgi:16S rRNA processing protein RimM|nr:ribosome maturation factor RimM [Treponema sp.]
MTERFVAALVGPPFGLKGFVKLRSLSGETGHLLKLKQLTLYLAGQEQVREIEAVEAAFPSLLVKFRGIDSPEAAKALGGAEILVDRDQAAPLGPGEYYIEDLKGIEVWEGAEPVGRITDVLEGGGGSLAELRLTTGETRLVPFRDEFFGEIDIEGRRAELRCRWILA